MVFQVTGMVSASVSIRPTVGCVTNPSPSPAIAVAQPSASISAASDRMIHTFCFMPFSSSFMCALVLRHKKL